MATPSRKILPVDLATARTGATAWFDRAGVSPRAVAVALLLLVASATLLGTMSSRRDATDAAAGDLASSIGSTNPARDRDDVDVEPVPDPDAPDVLEEEQKTEERLEKQHCASRRKERVGFDKGPRLVYLHLPKAGGTSIQTAMRHWVDGAPSGKASFRIFNGPSFFQSSFACPAGALGYSVLAGHRGYGFCRDVEHATRGTFIFTAFREPVSRIVSLHDYNLITIAAQKDKWEDSFRKGESFSDAIKRFNRTEEVEAGESLLRYAASQQTRFLCGYECMGPNVRGNETYTDAFMLRKAKANLRKLDVVGITERLDDLIPVLKMHLQLVPRGFSRWPESNSLPPSKKSKIDDEAKAILAKWAWADRELYAEADAIAKRMFEEAKRCEGALSASRGP